MMKNTHIVYLSTFMPRDIKDDISRNIKNFNFNSADAFSYSILKGLQENIEFNFTCINIAPLGAYPRFNTKSYFSEHTYIDNGVKVKSIRFSTIIGYMYYSIYSNMLNELVKLESDAKDLVFIVYSINIPVLKALIRYKLHYNVNIKIILIIPDQIEDLKNNTIRSKIKTTLYGNIQQIYSYIDGFVLLTKYMNDRINDRKPYCIVEGIFNDSEHRIIMESSKKKKNILYTGMLYEKFGVKDLIEAFMLTKDNDFRLILCGCGELEEYIKKSQLKDDRIIYLGLISREKALKLQSSSYLVINPRKPDYDFTKYSFPSKNIEYLASGTPVLLYELPGIPTEYYDYCYHLPINKSSINDLKLAIEQILSESTSHLDTLTRRAYEFIKNEKNSKTQVAKILNLINKI